MQKSYLLTPGPTPVPTEALLAMAKPIIHHRTPQFVSILKEAVEGLKYVYQTKNDVFIFTSSGTGAMEGAIADPLGQPPSKFTIELRNGLKATLPFADRRDFDWSREQVRSRSLSQRFEVLFGPVFGELSPAVLAAWILNSGLRVRLQLQQHKYVWDPAARGV